MASKQVGRGLVTQSAPRFRDFVVVDDTWEEDDALQVEQSRDGASNVYNYTGWSPGQQCQCDWWVRKGAARVGTLDVVVESFLILFTAQPAANDTIIIGLPTGAEKTYKFVVALSDPAVVNEVLIGANLLATITNFKDAVMATAGKLGTTVGTGTTISTVAVATVDLADGYGVQLDQLPTGEKPWHIDNALGIGGTCDVAEVNDVALPDLGQLAARPFIVPEAPKTKSFGGRKLKQTVKLNLHLDGFVPEVVTD